MATVQKLYAGRPRGFVPDETQAAAFSALCLATNANRKHGSAALSTRILANGGVVYQDGKALRIDPVPELREVLESHSSKHTLPVSLRELARSAAALVPFHRQGERALRANGPYVQGQLRMHWRKERRLRAGEVLVVDDATANTPCVIPWPWATCPCSQKYGVKVGRWQTLMVLDCAWDVIPAYSSVFREKQSYTQVDTAGIIIRTERDYSQPDYWIVEGGTWQSERMRALLAGRYVSAKGQPQQKLIENFFGRLWTRMSVLRGDVGRFRGEIEKNSKKYIEARAGKFDPRNEFLMLEDFQDALIASLRDLENEQIESPTYGKWIPAECNARDLANYPREVSAGDLWMALPVKAERVVSRNKMVSVREPGPLGVAMDFKFMAPELWNHEGRRVDVYFDPLSEWPVRAFIAHRGTSKLICEAFCDNPLADSCADATARAASVRRLMRMEYNAIWNRLGPCRVRESHVRGPSGTATITGLISEESRNTGMDFSPRVSAPRREIPEVRVECGRDEGRAAYLAQFRADASAFRAGTDDEAPPTARRLDAAAFIDTNP